MAVCKCFINDQLLPVRAGCEAIYCKDVNSDTAIRNEALSRITSLRAQVARLEGEREDDMRLIRGLERLHPLGSDIEGCGKRIRDLEAAIRAKDAALREAICPDHRDIYKLEEACLDDGCNWARQVLLKVGSDAGKGWLPPEVREQARRAIEAARQHGSFEHGWVVARLDEAADLLKEE